jgi:hypothetical protein
MSAPAPPPFNPSATNLTTHEKEILQEIIAQTCLTPSEEKLVKLPVWRHTQAKEQLPNLKINDSYLQDKLSISKANLSEILHTNAIIIPLARSHLVSLQHNPS